MTTVTKTARADVYEEVTNEIIASLENGCRPWSPSWSSAAASLPRRQCATPYQGINILLLWAQAIKRGYSNPHWMTFKQALDLGGCVRKGETGSMVVYAGQICRDNDEGREGDEPERRIPFLKRYVVFNVEQIDGLPEGMFPAPALAIVNRDHRDAELDQLFKDYGVPIRETGADAYYDEAADRITMPAFASFSSGDAFYATLAHEAVHSTGHRSRLDRETLHKYSEDTATRAREELVAEIGAAFLCAALGMEPTQREDHAAYISHWLDELRRDKRAIFQAARAAQAASDFILSKIGEARCNDPAGIERKAA
jgi:antirestriction protein ArdC